MAVHNGTHLQIDPCDHKCQQVRQSWAEMQRRELDMEFTISNGN